MKWISVKDSLPAPEVRVLAFDTHYNEIGIASFWEWSDRFIFEEDEDDCNITHWMPLPDPPTECQP